MFSSKKNIYNQETEVVPNRSALLVLIFLLVGVIFCWIMAEIGIFRVGKTVIRIGSVIPLVVTSVPFGLMVSRKESLGDPRMKYLVMAAAVIFTLATTTLMTFHTTIMNLFPIFVAMLYRSKRLGVIGFTASMFCTVFSPIFGYLLGTWDIPLFQELILIGTGGTAEIVNPTYTVTWLGVGKIVLYIVIPRLIMVGSCSLLMFHVIKLGATHVNNQVLLSEYSRRDTLTGLFNRNTYVEILNAGHTEGNVAVVFFDVNNLKQANDSKGHEYGDLLLQRCAKSLLSVCDEERVGGFRMGGDEFMLLCLDMDEDELCDLIERIKAALAEINRQNSREFNDLHCSMAIGWQIGPMSRLEELVRGADEFMYANKAKMKAQEGAMKG